MTPSRSFATAADGGGNIMKLVSCLMALTVGVVLVAWMVPGAAAVQPCDKLLTLQDVTRAVGPGFTRTHPLIAPPTACAYGRKQNEERVWLSPEETPGGAAQKLAQLSTTYKRINAAVKEVSGLGPGAFYTEDKDTGQTIVYFGKGNLFLELTHKVGSQSDPKAALALAKVVYARL